MILRSYLIRNGCRIATPCFKQSWRRPLATEANLDPPSQSSVDAIDQELKGAIQQTKSIESQTQGVSEQLVPQIDTQTHTTQNFLQDGTAQAHRMYRRKEKREKHLGTEIDPHYEPRLLINNPPRPSDITLELLLASQCHLGHKTSHWNPGNSQYVFGIREGIHIISLEVTAAYLRRACRVVSAVAERGGLILFAGTRPGQDRSVVEAAKRAGGYHLFDKWTPGAITNGLRILGRCKTKVVNEFDEEIPGFSRDLAEKSSLKPDLVVCLNPMENWVLLHECGLNNVPTIGILDTNADPTWLTYPIPANDDSLRCTSLIAGILGRAGEEGQAARKEMAREGQVPYPGIKLRSDASIEEMSARERDEDSAPATQKSDV